MDDETVLDPTAVAAKWEEIAPAIDKMAERIADPNDFQIGPGSSLSGDDKASNPYQVSHAVRMCLVAGVDHLHAVKVLLLDVQVFHAAAPFSLLRGSLENLSAAFWILHPRTRNERIERALRWHAKNFHEQHIALEPSGLSEKAKRDTKLAKLDVVATQRGISTDKVRAGYWSSGAVKYAEEHAKRSEPLLSWRLCSGYAHGRPWAYLSMSEHEYFETTDPGVLNLKLTSDPSRLLYPALAAFQLLIDVVELLQQRS
jgi:hypothetical protein